MHHSKPEKHGCAQTHTHTHSRFLTHIDERKHTQFRTHIHTWHVVMNSPAATYQLSANPPLAGVLRSACLCSGGIPHPADSTVVLVEKSSVQKASCDPIQTEISSVWHHFPLNPLCCPRVCTQRLTLILDHSEVSVIPPSFCHKLLDKLINSMSETIPKKELAFMGTENNPDQGIACPLLIYERRVLSAGKQSVYCGLAF